VLGYCKYALLCIKQRALEQQQRALEQQRLGEARRSEEQLQQRVLEHQRRLEAARRLEQQQQQRVELEERRRSKELLAPKPQLPYTPNGINGLCEGDCLVERPVPDFWDYHPPRP
jgi:hypothetical protein